MAKISNMLILSNGLMSSKNISELVNLLNHIYLNLFSRRWRDSLYQTSLSFDAT